MVSLAEMHAPSPASRSSSPASIQRRSNARSMRTVRSNLYKDDTTQTIPPAASAALSENLADSIVDFELAAAAAGGGLTAAKSASQHAATAELLGLSRDFSFTFNSDISGELQRLASLLDVSTPQSPYTTAISTTSTEFIDLEGVEPIVRACVQDLTQSSPVEAKRAAAGKLRLLAKHRSDFRELIGAAGAIPALVALLRSTDPVTQENSVTALLNLSLEEVNKTPMTDAGAIKPLVYALRTGTSTAKQNAACALLSLSMIEENRATIGSCGAIPPLVSLLVQGSSRGKKDALTTLYKLCSERRNKERAVTAGAVGTLVAMAAERGGGTAEKALVVMSSLAGIPEGRAAIVEEGGMPALVEAIEDGLAKGKEFAVVTLLQLCSDSLQNRCLLVREGAIPPLVALSQSGSARAKHKAETLLRYLREQRNDGASSAMTR